MLLAIVRTQAEVALRSARDGDEYRRVLREITAGVERMAGTLQSLLLLARADTGNLDYVEEEVDVGATVHEAFERHRAAATHKGLELRVAAATNAAIRGSARKGLVLPSMAKTARAGVDDSATLQVTTSTTAVRMAVARWESAPATPTFARIAEAPASRAESNAHQNQVMRAS